MVKSSLARKKVVRKTRKHMKRGKVGKNKTHRKKSTKKALKKRSRRNTLKRKKSRKIKRGGVIQRGTKNRTATRRPSRHTQNSQFGPVVKPREGEEEERDFVDIETIPEKPLVNNRQLTYAELNLPENPNPSAMGVRPSQTVYSQAVGTTTQKPF